LLDRGANVLARNAAGETPLFLAHQHNQFAEAGYVRPPEVPESFRDAIMRGNTNMVGIYLKAEPRLVSTPDGHGTLPIDYAAYPPQPWVARQFLAAGSPLTPGVAVILGRVRDFPRLLNPLDPVARDWLLYVAVITSQLDSLVWLLEHGANPNSQDESGFTPAYYLSLRKGAPPELAQMLEKHGATPSLFDAIAKGDQSTLERLLAAQPASARATNRAGQTPLLRAIFATNRLAFDRLLERGADVNAATSRCFTPLHAAAALGRDDFAAELLGCGADPRACDEFSDTPLHWAARSGATKVADLLLAAGADVNAQNGNERLGHWNSPLHTAAENFQIEMVQWLLQHGADLNVTNQYKFTPLEQARQGRWSGRVWERGLSPIQPDPTLRAATIAALEKAQPATPQPQ